MPTIKHSALVLHTPARMYELVNSIEHYPEFLPWCVGTEVHSRTIDEVRATINISKSGIQQAFTTFNRMQTNKMIELRLVAGPPLQHLEGFWRFDAVGDEGCRICLDLEFEFSNKLIDKLVRSVLDKASGTFVDAFCQRAKALYG